jgi:phage baseplate assembly protein gpV
MSSTRKNPSRRIYNWSVAAAAVDAAAGATTVVEAAAVTATAAEAAAVTAMAVEAAGAAAEAALGFGGEVAAAVEAVQTVTGAGGMAFGSGATIDNWVAIGAALPQIAILNRNLTAV